MGHKRKVELCCEDFKKTFDSVKEASVFLKVTSSAVTFALNKNKRVKKHTVTLIPEESHTDEIWLFHETNNFFVSNKGRFRKNNEIYDGSVSSRDGYKRCRLNGKTYLMHIPCLQAFDPFGEFVWYHSQGVQPQVDHLNKDRADNNIDNLHWVTRSENMVLAKAK